MKRSSAWFMVCAAPLSLACGSSDEDDVTAEATAEVTWHQHVAPLVTEKCVGCHASGGIAPFSMEAWEDAQPWAKKMAEETAAGTMPPFLAADTDECVPRLGWKDDLRLSTREKAILRAWADAGGPEGDAGSAAPLPEPVALDLPDPDLSLRIPVSVDIDGTKDQFWCFVLDTKLPEDRWFNAMQVNAGNSRIVHHVLVYDDVNHALDAKSAAAGKYECFGGVGIAGASLINAWAPGGVPFRTPPDVAFQLRKDARVVLQVHYHPTGAKETDSATGIDLEIAPATPKYRTAVSLIGNFVSPNLIGGLLPGPDDPDHVVEFRVPAGTKDHLESMVYNVTSSTDQIVWSMGTHMHYVGTDMAVHLRRAAPKDGEPAQECLIQTPRWNFNWQRGYAYDAPLDQVPVARAGDQYLLQCHYDNSMDNPFVVEALRQQQLSAPRDVFMGETTLDEMCLGAFGIATKIETPAP